MFAILVNTDNHRFMSFYTEVIGECYHIDQIHNVTKHSLVNVDLYKMILANVGNVDII